MRIVINHKLKLFFIFIMMKIVTELGYINIGQIFHYTGIEIQYNSEFYIYSWIIALVIFYISCYKLQWNYSGIINIIFMILSFIPTISLWGIKEGITLSGVIASSIYIAMMLCACSVFNRHSFEVSENRSELIIEKFNVVKLLIVAVFIISFLIHRVYAPGRLLLTFSNSLDVRLDLREVHISTIPRYLYMMFGWCIAPFLSIVALSNRKYFWAVLAFASEYLLYTVNGMKTWIMFIVLIIGFWFLSVLKVRINKAITTISFGVVVGWLIGLMVYVMYGRTVILAYLHRIFTLPAEIHYYYFDYTNKKGLLFLRDSIMRFFFPSTEEYTRSRLIGMVYYKSQTMNCSNGLFSDFYSNFGYIGLIIYPFMIYLCLSFWEKQTREQNAFVVIATVTVSLMALYDNPFFTWMLTGGYLVLVFVMFLINRSRLK